MRAIVMGVVFLALAAAAYAACPATIQSTTTTAFIQEAPSLNTDLQSCPASVPSSASKFAGNGNVLFVIAMADGTTQNVCVLTANNQVSGVSVGACTATTTVRITEGNFDGVLQSTSRGNAVSQLFLSGQITIRPSGFFKRVGFFFAKPFVKKAVRNNAPPTVNPGPPKFCDETSMEGHEGYQYAKALWDGYKADTDGVCQMQQGYMNDDHCIYGVQQSKGGIPYYLCFYRN